jgi:hypothetical protein
MSLFGGSKSLGTQQTPALPINSFERFLWQFGGLFVPFVQAQLHRIQAATPDADGAAVLDNFANYSAEAVPDTHSVTDMKLARRFARHLH